MNIQFTSNVKSKNGIKLKNFVVSTNATVLYQTKRFIKLKTISQKPSKNKRKKSVVFF